MRRLVVRARAASPFVDNVGTYLADHIDLAVARRRTQDFQRGRDIFPRRDDAHHDAAGAQFTCNRPGVDAGHAWHTVFL